MLMSAGTDVDGREQQRLAAAQVTQPVEAYNDR
jgi:hypothetical protein